ncbi:MAG: VanW family protein [Clostridia bacterium]|nr:VanW family protein [Clostridia bacterium]
MKRKLFCEISPFTYWISKQKNIIMRNMRDRLNNVSFATKKSDSELPFLIFEHKSLIRRVLGNIDMTFQENKAVNLALSAPKINKVLIYPGEIFSFWKLVGKCKASKGYKRGLTISNSKVGDDIGGGMCQFTNLLYWLVLHSPLKVIEHHHHDDFDLFPDYDRKVPFGTGTSITYNYLDLRIKNDTDSIFQFVVYVTDTYLNGELRSSEELNFEYEIRTDQERFVRESDGVYRKGLVYRKCIDKRTNEVVFSECIRKNNAKVMYEIDELIVEGNK